MCEEHHKYWLGDKQLASVSSVLRVWPQETCSGCGWPMFSEHMAGCLVKEKVEHAKERGIRVDRYCQEFVRMGKVAIPAGERSEVVGLTEKAVAWFQKAKNGNPVEAQVIVHDEEIAGTLDFRIVDRLTDLKCTYDAGGMTHRLQLGAYAQLCLYSLGSIPEDVGILHVTERYKQAKWIPFDVDECIRDWKTVRAMWELTQRGR